MVEKAHKAAQIQNVDNNGNILGGSADNPIFFVGDGEYQSASASASEYESVTIADSAIGLSALIYVNATKAEMSLEDAEIRIRKDGTNPTASEGHIVYPGDEIILGSAADIANFKAIRTGSTSGILKVTYSE